MNDSSVIAERYVYDNKVWNQTTADCFDIQTERNAWLAGTSYADNQMFSIERIAIQASSGDIGSLDTKVFAQQDFIVQEPAVSAAGEYSFTLGEAEDVNGTSIGQFIPTKCTFDLSAQLPVEYQIVFEVVLPDTIIPTEMNSFLYSNEEINTTSGDSNIERHLDENGKVTITDVVLDETYRLLVNPIGASHIDDIITVTDAYRAFKGLNDVGINGNEGIFDEWEEFVADVNLDNKFDSQDVGMILSKVIGQPVAESCIPYVINGDKEYGCYSSVNYENYTLEILRGNDQGTDWTDGVIFTTEDAASTTIKNQRVAFWQHGDIDFSHSTAYPIPSSGKSMFNKGSGVVNSANVGLVSRIEGGKVYVDLDLSTSGLAGLQAKIDYDGSVLNLEEIKYNTGSTVTNFSKVVGGKLVFGSLSLEGDTIETGTAYTLVFDMKQNVTNTTGLFYFYNTDAVKLSGEKLNLNIR